MLYACFGVILVITLLQIVSIVLLVNSYNRLLDEYRDRHHDS